MNWFLFIHAMNTWTWNTIQVRNQSLHFDDVYRRYISRVLSICCRNHIKWNKLCLRLGVCMNCKFRICSLIRLMDLRQNLQGHLRWTPVLARTPAVSLTINSWKNMSCWSSRCEMQLVFYYVITLSHTVWNETI